MPQQQLNDETTFTGSSWDADDSPLSTVRSVIGVVGNTSAPKQGKLTMFPVRVNEQLPASNIAGMPGRRREDKPRLVKPPFIVTENKTMLTCDGVANYFLAHVSEDEGDLISNLKLQKLMYYAQGFHLALHDTPLFPESIEAWMHGPVVPELYQVYKQYGAGALPLPTGIDFSIYDEETRELLDEVNSVFGQFSAWKLANMTHGEPPWQEAAKDKSEISHEAMKSYFKTQLISG